MVNAAAQFPSRCEAQLSIWCEIARLTAAVFCRLFVQCCLLDVESAIEPASEDRPRGTSSSTVRGSTTPLLTSCLAAFRGLGSATRRVSTEADLGKILDSLLHPPCCASEATGEHWDIHARLTRERGRGTAMAGSDEPETERGMMVGIDRFKRDLANCKRAELATDVVSCALAVDVGTEEADNDGAEVEDRVSSVR